MKQGKSLVDLATELERQSETKKDYIADTRKLYMTPNGDIEIQMQDPFTVTPTTHAHKQLATWANIPQKYYDLCPAELRAVNVNHWLRNEPGQRMIRTLDGKARAFLSNRYRCLDNFDLAEAVLPVLQEVPEMQVISCDLTETRMYIKALFPRITGDLGKGDMVQSGVVISNSEIGHGSLKVEPLVYRLVCLNGMISGYSQKRYHVGRASNTEGDASEIFRDETLQADDKAFWMKVQDTVRASVDQIKFDKIVDHMKETKANKIEQDPVEVVEKVQKKYSLTDTERGGILRHLVEGGDMSQFGLVNAVTRTSQDLEQYDRATEFERLGGQIVELPKASWQALAA